MAVSLFLFVISLFGLILSLSLYLSLSLSLIWFCVLFCLRPFQATFIHYAVLSQRRTLKKRWIPTKKWKKTLQIPDVLFAHRAAAAGGHYNENIKQHNILIFCAYFSFSISFIRFTNLISHHFISLLPLSTPCSLAFQNSWSEFTLPQASDTNLTFLGTQQ